MFIPARKIRWLLFSFKVLGIIVISDLTFYPILLVRGVSFVDALVPLLPFNSMFLIVFGAFILFTSFFSTKEVEDREYRGFGVGYIRKTRFLAKTREEKLHAMKEGILMIAIGLLLFLVFYLST